MCLFITFLYQLEVNFFINSTNFIQKLFSSLHFISIFHIVTFRAFSLTFRNLVIPSFNFIYSIIHLSMRLRAFNFILIQDPVSKFRID